MGLEKLPPMAVRGVLYIHPMYSPIHAAKTNKGGCPFKRKDQSNICLAAS
jgi:hypothetical protein